MRIGRTRLRFGGTACSDAVLRPHREIRGFFKLPGTGLAGHVAG